MEHPVDKAFAQAQANEIMQWQQLLAVVANVAVSLLPHEKVKLTVIGYKEELRHGEAMEPTNTLEPETMLQNYFCFSVVQEFKGRYGVVSQDKSLRDTEQQI